MLVSGIFFLLTFMAFGQLPEHNHIQMLSNEEIKHAKTGIIVPLYRHPGPSWDVLIKAKHMHKSVLILAIVNPDNGPGTGALNYVSGINRLQSAGIPVLGYVYTHYGNRDPAEIMNDIDEYKRWYGINGIFFDEMAHVHGKENYYLSLSKYAKSIGIDFTVGNPGNGTSPTYVGTVDNIVIYEHSGLPSSQSIEGWYSQYPKTNFSILPYGVEKLNETHIRELSEHIGFIYVTDQTLPNPWYSLATYFDQFVSIISSINNESVSSDSHDDHHKECGDSCRVEMTS